MAFSSCTQATNGSFAETGRVINERLQEDSVAMTAFAALAFLDNRFYLEQRQRNSMNRAISYLAETWRDLDEPFTLSLATYVLHLADHPQKDTAFQLLESFAVVKSRPFHTETRVSVRNVNVVYFSSDNGDVDYKFWETQLEGFEKNPWTQFPNSANIAMTSYALLTSLSRGRFDDSLPIVRWLLSQQNERGGFASTFDTYVGVAALAEFSRAIPVSTSVGTNEVRTQSSFLVIVVSKSRSYSSCVLSRSPCNTRICLQYAGCRSRPTPARCCSDAFCLRRPVKSESGHPVEDLPLSRWALSTTST